jgi:hypothetical protein
MYEGRLDGLGCEGGKWMEDFDNRAQWRGLVSPALNLWVLLSTFA